MIYSKKEFIKRFEKALSEQTDDAMEAVIDAFIRVCKYHIEDVSYCGLEVLHNLTMSSMRLIGCKCFDDLDSEAIEVAEEHIQFIQSRMNMLDFGEVTERAALPFLSRLYWLWGYFQSGGKV